MIVDFEMLLSSILNLVIQGHSLLSFSEISLNYHIENS